MNFAMRVIVFVTLFAAIPAQSARPNSQMQMAPASSADPAWSELQTSMSKMDSAMASIGPSGNSDVDFVKMMLPHHQAAIDMAKSELLHGKDPQMRRLAQEIITD